MQKIYLQAEIIFSVSETMICGIQKIFSVIETTVSATENIFSGMGKILVAPGHSFFVTKGLRCHAKQTYAECRPPSLRRPRCGCWAEMPQRCRTGCAVPNSVFADTSAWIAFLIARDQYHFESEQLFRKAILKKVRLLSTNLVLAEIHRLILHRWELKLQRVCSTELKPAPGL
jgi:hypothetical protein